MHPHYGIKTGFIFALISFVAGATFILPIIYIGIFEFVMGAIADKFNPNVGQACFYISFIAIAISTVLYAVALLAKTEAIEDSFMLLLLTLLFFLGPMLFYADWLNPKFRVDGQQIFGIVPLFIKSSWVYIVLGFCHDWWIEKYLS